MPTPDPFAQFKDAPAVDAFSHFKDAPPDAPPNESFLEKARDVIGRAAESTPLGAAIVPTMEMFGYQPRTPLGRAYSDISKIPERIAEAGGQKAADVTQSMGGTPEQAGMAGAAAKTGITALEMFTPQGVETVGARMASRMAPGAKSAATAAKDFVESRAGIAWSDLPQWMQTTLEKIAKESGNLEKLDPESIVRQARLAAAKMPATRDQVTRNIAQRTTRDILIKTESGQPLRDIMSVQDERLHGLLDELRVATGAKTVTRSQTGGSVQGSLRTQLRSAKSKAKAAYDAQNNIGETLSVGTQQIEQFLEDPINKANVGWIRDRLNGYRQPDGTISLKHLEDVRQELTAAAKNPNKGGHYASNAVKEIDKMLDNAGSDIYKTARAEWKAMKDTYDKQARVKRLVTEKGMSNERAVALENTTDMIIKSPSEEIVKIAKTLKQTTSGRQAWRDLQGQTLEHLREKATGRRRIANEKGVTQFNSTFLDEFREMDANGRIDAIFDKPVAEQLRKIAQIVEDVRSAPSGRVSGSDSIPKLFNATEGLLGKLADVKGIGTAVAMAKKFASVGEEARQVRSALKPDLLDQAEKLRRPQTLRSLPAGVIGGASLSGDDQ